MGANLVNSSEFPNNSRGFLASNADEIAIKNYFRKILELSESGEEFPINLEEVWPLAFSRKDSAVRELVSKFIEGVDYHVLLKNVEQKSGPGGHNKVDYMISVPCLEYLIARRVRSVFDVYRMVFHQTIKEKKLDGLPTDYLEALKALVVKEEERLRLEEEKKKLEERIAIESGSLSMKDVRRRLESKNYFIKERALKKFLRAIGFFTKNRKIWELKPSVVEKGYGCYRSIKDGNGGFTQNACMTELGFELVIRSLGQDKWFDVFTSCGGSFGKQSPIQESLFSDNM